MLINTTLDLTRAAAAVRNAFAQQAGGTPLVERFVSAEAWLEERRQDCWPRVGSQLFGDIYTAKNATEDVRALNDAVADVRRMARILGVQMPDTGLDHS